MAAPKADPKAVLEFATHNNVQMLDLRFTDLPGLWHHVSYPIGQLTEESFEEGFGMDGSSIRGWAAIHESDMLLIPDASRYLLATGNVDHRSGHHHATSDHRTGTDRTRRNVAIGEVRPDDLDV